MVKKVTGGPRTSPTELAAGLIRRTLGVQQAPLLRAGDGVLSTIGGWTKSISQVETMVEAIHYWYLQVNQQKPGFLNGGAGLRPFTVGGLLDK